jgi:hypothetical protein
MTLPDRLAGKRHRCPLCLAYFEVPYPGDELSPALVQKKNGASGAEASPLRAAKTRPPEPGEGEPDQADEGGPWRWVSLGLGLYYARLVALLFLVLLVILQLVILVLAWGQLSDSWVAVALAGGMLLLQIIGPFLALLGSLLCLGTPARARARRFLVTSLVLDLAALGLGSLLPLEVVSEDLEPYLTWLGLGLVFASWVFFLYYLRQLALYFGEEATAREALAIVGRGVYLLALPLLVLAAIHVVAAVLDRPAVPALVDMAAGCLAVPLLIGLATYLFVAFVLILFRQLDLIGTLRQLMWTRGEKG